jgi:hypothetical protein
MKNALLGSKTTSKLGVVSVQVLQDDRRHQNISVASQVFAKL